MSERHRWRIRVLDWWDGIEMISYAVAGVIVLGIAVGLGVRSSYRIGGPLFATAVLLLLVIILAGVVRDIRRRQWSPASVALLAAYGLALVAVVVLEGISR